MDREALTASLQGAVTGARIEFAPSIDLQPTMYTAPGDVLVVARALRDHPSLRFALLSDLTATDYHPREPRFELTYILVSIEHGLRLRWKVQLRGDGARVATVSDIWPAANWLEREVWDLFGIEFDGHPDLRRLLMPDDWEGFPLRKDYPVQIQLKPRSTEPLQVSQEEFRANLERDRMTRR